MAGKLVIISGPSGTGKSTICKRLCEKDSRIRLSVSATTRPPRTGEHHGVDYYFISRDEFDKKIAAGEFAEHAEYAGRLYGTLREPVDEAVSRGLIVLLDIDVQGAEQVIGKYPDAVTIFIEPPDFEELLRRLHNRNTDSPEEKEKRVAIARGEMEKSHQYKHRIVNDDLDDTVEKIYSLIAGR